MSVKVLYRPQQPKICSGNIIWADCDSGSAYYRTSKLLGNNGKFTARHPVCPNAGAMETGGDAQCGLTDPIKAFRARGYWASCFPEGDGITFQRERDQDDDTVKRDIVECFGFEIVDSERAVYRQWDPAKSAPHA